MTAVLMVLAVFVIVIVLMKFKMELGYALLAGALCLGLFFRMSWPAIARSGWQAVCSRDTIELVGIVCLILVLSHILDKTGQFLRASLP